MPQYTQKLSANFRMREFLVSSRYPLLASAMHPNLIQQERFRFISVAFLEIIRAFIDRAMFITSGMRSSQLNSAVNGSIGSDHLFKGSSGAVDFTVKFTELEKRFAWMRRRVMRKIFRWMKRNIPNFKYIILYKNEDFIHLSLPDDSGRIGESWIESD